MYIQSFVHNIPRLPHNIKYLLLKYYITTYVYYICVTRNNITYTHVSFQRLLYCLKQVLLELFFRNPHRIKLKKSIIIKLCVFVCKGHLAFLVLQCILVVQSAVDGVAYRKRGNATHDVTGQDVLYIHTYMFCVR